MSVSGRRAPRGPSFAFRGAGRAGAGSQRRSRPGPARGAERFCSAARTQSRAAPEPGPRAPPARASRSPPPEAGLGRRALFCPPYWGRPWASADAEPCTGGRASLAVFPHCLALRGRGREWRGRGRVLLNCEARLVRRVGMRAAYVFKALLSLEWEKKIFVFLFPERSPPPLPS